MEKEQLEKVIKSTVHIIMSEPKTLAPKGIGSGCVVSFNGKEILLTAAHVTDKKNAGTCIVTGRNSEMYSVGAMTYLERFNFEKYKEQIKLLKTEPNRFEDIDFGLIDFSFATLQDKADFIQRKIEFKEFTVSESKKQITQTYLTDTPKKENVYAFFGRIKPYYFKRTLYGDVFETQEVMYGGLKFVRKIGCYYEFELPNVIQDHTDFKGTSGAPIMDEEGTIVSLITHGYTGANRIYGIALSDFRSGVEAMILTDEMNKH